VAVTSSSGHATIREETARRPMVREQWQNAGDNWVLMIKDKSD